MCKLADGRAALSAVRQAVDHHRTGAADAFAAIGIERNRLLAFGDQILVDHVEHFQKGHVGQDIGGLVSDQPAFAFGVLLPPDFQGKIHARFAHL
jgi:hypothetical protein